MASNTKIDFFICLEISKISQKPTKQYDLLDC